MVTQCMLRKLEVKVKFLTALDLVKCLKQIKYKLKRGEKACLRVLEEVTIYVCTFVCLYFVS